jgi:hypothetical protein
MNLVIEAMAKALAGVDGDDEWNMFTHKTRRSYRKDARAAWLVGVDALTDAHWEAIRLGCNRFEGRQALKQVVNDE